MSQPPSSPFGGARLARIGGIDIRVHWTWGIAASLITLGLATSVFPGEVPGLSGGTYYVMAVTTAVLFFVSLLLHELGHALQARREGIPTSAITLWMLGGIAQGTARFENPGAEARVIAAGPAVSAFLAAALISAGRATLLPPEIAVVCEWLGWTNLLLLGFNLLPALPLDGGRLLHAALWRLRHDRVGATRDAARVSHVLALGMIGAGVAGLALNQGVAALWLGFVGIFVMSAGRAERAGAETEAALEGLHVADVMTPGPSVVEPSVSARQLLEHGRRAGHAAYPVVDEGGRVLGLVSTATADRLPEALRGQVTVADILADAPDPLLLDAETDVLHAARALVVNPMHRAPVLRGGRLVGIVSLSDVARAARDRRRSAGLGRPAPRASARGRRA